MTRVARIAPFVGALGALMLGPVAEGTPSTGTSATRAAYSNSVTHICAGALLFAGAHEIGTRSGAIAVSRDIRATGTQRMRRVEAVPNPALLTRVVASWVALERRLVTMYATNYLRIWNEIEQANTARERATLPARLVPLIREPDALQQRARVLEHTLGVPDYTGGASTGTDPMVRDAR